MGENYIIKLQPEGARCELPDTVEEMLQAFGISVDELRSGDSECNKVVNASMADKKFKQFADDLFVECGVKAESGKFLDTKCLDSWHQRCSLWGDPKRECIDELRGKRNNETAQLEAEKRITKFCEKNGIAPEKYLYFVQKLGRNNVELMIHKFVDPKYPAPKGFDAFDDKVLFDSDWKRLVGTFVPIKSAIPTAIEESTKGVEWFRAIRNTESREVIHATKICVGAASGYQIYLTADHVLKDKILPVPTGTKTKSLGNDLALVALPLEKGEKPCKAVRFGEKLKGNENFYSKGFGGTGKHPMNLCSGATYAKLNMHSSSSWVVEKNVDRLVFNSLAYSSDSGGGVFDKQGRLVGIMLAVGGEQTVKSRLTTYAYGDMKFVKEALDEFKEKLAAEKK